MKNFYNVLAIPTDALIAENVGKIRRYAVLAENKDDAMNRVRSETNWQPHLYTSVYIIDPRSKYDHILDEQDLG